MGQESGAAALAGTPEQGAVEVPWASADLVAYLAT